MLLKTLIFLLLLISILISRSYAAPPKNRQKSFTSQERQIFQTWKQRHKKSYKSTVDEQKAMTNMLKNLREIEAHNKLYEAGKVSYRRAVWEQSDLNYEEKQKVLIGQKQVQIVGNETKTGRLMASALSKLKATPAEVNWVKAGLVNPIRNQGKCGSCWSYTAASVAEGVLLKKGIKTRLSEQNLVDCSKNGGNSGCNGGDSYAALKYISRNGIASLDDYPYTGRNGKCRASSMEKVKFSLGTVKYERLRGNEDRLKNIVAQYGPVAVAIRAADSFMNYESGIYNNPKCSRNLDHAVTLVGYGRDNKTNMDFWLVKNSWVGKVNVNLK